MANIMGYFAAMVALAFSSEAFARKFLILAFRAGAIVRLTKPDEIGAHPVA